MTATATDATEAQPQAAPANAPLSNVIPLHAHRTVNWTPNFIDTIEEIKKRRDAKRIFKEEVMQDGMHFRTIPGSDKPALLKPGAELLLKEMGLYAELSDEESPTRDLLGIQHNGEPYINYRRICRIWRQTGFTKDDRVLVAQASGSCNSWEVKYRYRESKRLCPECKTDAIIKGNADFGGGWVCWAKKGGCGTKFMDQDQRIIGQKPGRVPNPDVAELDNTILKMGDKRALVAATLVATGCSDIFTQDIEDFEHENPPGENGKTPQSNAPANNPPADLRNTVTKEQRDELRAVLKERDINEKEFVHANSKGYADNLDSKKLKPGDLARMRSALNLGKPQSKPAENRPAQPAQASDLRAPAPTAQHAQTQNSPQINRGEETATRGRRDLLAKMLEERGLDCRKFFFEFRPTAAILTINDPKLTNQIASDAIDELKTRPRGASGTSKQPPAKARLAAIVGRIPEAKRPDLYKKFGVKGLEDNIPDDKAEQMIAACTTFLEQQSRNGNARTVKPAAATAGEQRY